MRRDGFRGLGHSARTARGCLTVDRKGSEGEGRPADRPTARRRLIDQDDLGEKQGRWLRALALWKSWEEVIVSTRTAV